MSTTARLMGLVVGAGVTVSVALAQSPYVVGARDVLAITVWNQLELSDQFTIDDNGTFDFPLIGAVEVGGLTVDEIEAQLEAELGEGFFQEPRVSVSVEEYHSQRVFIMGEVRVAGSYPLTGELTLLEALALAGSTTPEAARHVLIARPSPDNAPEGPWMPDTDEDDGIVEVDLAALQRGELSNNFRLADGDTVFVPRAERVFVFGQVTRPGAYPIGPGTTVRQVLSLAGGVTDRGAANRARIVRVVDQEEVELKVNMGDVVRPGDTVVVPERYF